MEIFRIEPPGGEGVAAVADVGERFGGLPVFQAEGAKESGFGLLQPGGGFFAQPVGLYYRCGDLVFEAVGEARDEQLSDL